MDPIRIICVCRANMCRSVMIEAFLKKLLAKEGKKYVTVESGGLMAMPGGSPLLRVVTVMDSYGIDVTGHRSRAVQSLNVQPDDLFCCVDEMIRQSLIDLGVTPGNIRVLNQDGGGIPDPFPSSNLQEYRDCAELIIKHIPALADSL